MLEKEAIAMYLGISLEAATEIYVDNLSDEDYEEILKLMNEDAPDWLTKS